MTTPRHRTTRPNDRAQRAAAKLIGIAPDITRAVELLRDQLASVGYPSSGGGDAKVSGGGRTIAVKHNDNGPEEVDHVPVTTVEMAMFIASKASGQREDLRDMITATENHVSALVRLVKHILGETMPNADGEALCADKQRGRDGVIEWGDATCTELPTQGGLCFRCYQRERRWRAGAGLADRSEPAA